MSQPLLRIFQELLLVVFLRIALLAALAVFGGLHAALVLAGFAGGLRIIAAACLSNAREAEYAQGAGDGDE